MCRYFGSFARCKNLQQPCYASKKDTNLQVVKLMIPLPLHSSQRIFVLDTLFAKVGIQADARFDTSAYLMRRCFE